eukprot:scaffold23942_cov84-Phaeocystis_antarctica.AAC.1
MARAKVEVLGVMELYRETLCLVHYRASGRLPATRAAVRAGVAHARLPECTTVRAGATLRSQKSTLT